MTLIPAVSLSPERTISPAEQLADIAVFRTTFMSLDRAYSPKKRAEAEERLALLERTDRPMTVTSFVVALCQVTALADNGHSTCFYPTTPDVTLSFELVSGDFHVLGSPEAQADLLGARLIALEGRPIASIRDKLRSLFGGAPAWRDVRVADLLARPAYLQALHLSSASRETSYRFRLSDGRTVERRLPVARRNLAWESLPKHGSVPWALDEPDVPFRFRDSPEFDALVVQLRRNADAPSRPIADFLEAAELTRSELGRRNVVLDMRQNGGGDFLTTRDFMLAWPIRVSALGRFFVLTGPKTFSAGIVSVAYLKQAGGDRVVLIGEPPGDRMMFFAEGRMTRLPNSLAEVSPASQRDDLATGCVGFNDCFAALAQPGALHGTPPELATQIDQRFGRKPLTVSGLRPDISAPWTVEDYEAGRDPAIAALSNYLVRS